MRAPLVLLPCAAMLACGTQAAEPSRRLDPAVATSEPAVPLTTSTPPTDAQARR